MEVHRSVNANGVRWLIRPDPAAFLGPEEAIGALLHRPLPNQLEQAESGRTILVALRVVQTKRLGVFLVFRVVVQAALQSVGCCVAAFGTCKSRSPLKVVVVYRILSRRRGNKSAGSC